MERLPRQFDDAPRRPGGLLRTGEAGHQQAKLGVAEPGKRIRSAQTLLDAPDQETDQLVGERLAQRIGDQLEQSEVDDEHGDRLLRAVRGQERLVDAIVEQDAVAQSGGIVAQRQTARGRPAAPDIVRTAARTRSPRHSRLLSDACSWMRWPLRRRPISARNGPSLRRNRRG